MVENCQRWINKWSIVFQLLISHFETRLGPYRLLWRVQTDWNNYESVPSTKYSYPKNFFALSIYLGRSKEYTQSVTEYDRLWSRRWEVVGRQAVYIWKDIGAPAVEFPYVLICWSWKGSMSMVIQLLLCPHTKSSFYLSRVRGNLFRVNFSSMKKLQMCLDSREIQIGRLTAQKICTRNANKTTRSRQLKVVS